MEGGRKLAGGGRDEDEGRMARRWREDERRMEEGREERWWENE